MPTTWTERLGRRLADNTAEQVWTGSGGNDDAAARADLITAAPATHDGLELETVEVEEVGQETNDDFLWMGTVTYGKPNRIEFDVDPLEPGEIAIEWDTSGGAQHITHSLSTVNSYTASGSAPDHQGAIGVNGDNIEGVEVPAPAFAFQVTKVFSSGSPPSPATIFNLTGTYNDAQFSVTDSRTGLTITIAANEGVFLGARGGRARQDAAIEVVFLFRASPNATGLSVGPITGIEKKGQDYLWVMYAPREDSAAKALTRRPIAAYVERVLHDGDWSTLSI